MNKCFYLFYKENSFFFFRQIEKKKHKHVDELWELSIHEKIFTHIFIGIYTYLSMYIKSRI